MDALNPIFVKDSLFVEKVPFKVPCTTCKIFPPTPDASFAAVTALTSAMLAVTTTSEPSSYLEPYSNCMISQLSMM